MKLRSFFSSLRGRMLWQIGVPVAVGLVALTLFVSQRSVSIVTHFAKEAATGDAVDVSLRIEADLSRPTMVVNGLGDAIELTKQLKADKREMLVELLRRNFEECPGTLGMWACFEPDTFGGADKDAVSTPGSDETGRFSPYWSKVNGKLNLETCPEYWKKDYYKQPLASRKAMLIEPYEDDAGGQKILMTSYALPIFDGDHVIGVIGVDYDCAALGKIINQNKQIAENGGYIALVSSGFKYVSHPKPERISKSFFDTDAWAKPYQEDMMQGRLVELETFSHTLNDVAFRVLAPVRLSSKLPPWVVMVTVPRGKVIAEVTKLRTILITIGAIVLAGVLAILFVLSGRIAAPIHELASGLRLGADHTSQAAGQVSQTSQSLAEGASKQAAALEETSSSLEELSSMTQQNSDSSEKAKQFANQARQSADNGVNEMQRMQEAMAAIQASSGEISKIIKTIDEIAFQTNILALNAAVEAARAGEAGAGFAIVAEEVRNLAQRSATAAKETGSKIEDSLGKTTQGVEISRKVGDSLSEIAQKIRLVDDLAGQVAAAAAEQSRGLTQINKAVSEIDQITQSNAASAEESASAAEELNAQSEVMRDSVAKLDALIQGE